MYETLMLAIIASYAYAGDLIKIKPNENPVYTDKTQIVYECEGNVDKIFLNDLYKYAKKHAIKKKAPPPLKKFCELTANYKPKTDTWSIQIDFYERDPKKGYDNTGVTVHFELFANRDVMVLSSYRIDEVTGIYPLDQNSIYEPSPCINQKGIEVDPSRCQ